MLLYSMGVFHFKLFHRLPTDSPSPLKLPISNEYGLIQAFDDHERGNCIDVADDQGLRFDSVQGASIQTKPSRLFLNKGWIEHFERSRFEVGF